jgi:hypothetical protein
MGKSNMDRMWESTFRRLHELRKNTKRAPKIGILFHFIFAGGRKGTETKVIHTKEANTR